MPDVHTSGPTRGEPTSSPAGLPVAQLTLLSAALFAAVLTEVMPVGLLPQLTEAFGVSEARVGWWMSAYALVVAAGAIPLTAVLVRWPRRRALVLLLAIYAASNALILVAPNYWVGLGGRVVGGVAHAGIFTVAMATAASLAPPGRTGRAIALVTAGSAPALALGLPAATAAGAAWGWRWPFAAATVVLLGLTLAAWRLMPDVPAAPAGGRPALAVLSAMRGRGLQLIGVTTVVFTVGHYSAYTYVTPMLLRAGIGQDAVSLVLLGYGVVALGGLLLGGALADRYPVRSLGASIAAVAVSLTALALAAHNASGAVAAVLVWGAAFSAIPILLNTAALRVSAVPDAAPAVVNAMFNVGIASGAWVGGQALERGGTVVVAGFAAVLVALSLPLSALPAARRRRRRAASVPAPAREVAPVP